MLLAKIERWYALNHQNEAELETRLSELKRALGARGGSIKAIHRNPDAASPEAVKVLCEVPIAGLLARM